ncbi:hypothetical protein L0P10_16970, partial [Eggerthella lenta]|nr:hypothetical protein [Eggerthella lenta]
DFNYISEDLNTDVFLIAVIAGIPIFQRGSNRIDQRRCRNITLATSKEGSRQSSGTANPYGLDCSRPLTFLSFKFIVPYSILDAQSALKD